MILARRLSTAILIAALCFAAPAWAQIGPGGGGSSGGNEAASATGSAVPAKADYQGINVAGTLRGATGASLGSTFSQHMAIVDGSGNQITSFGSTTPLAPITPAAATATQSQILGAQYNSTQATFTNGQQGSLQITSRGALMVGTGADQFKTAGSYGAAQVSSAVVSAASSGDNTLVTRAVGTIKVYGLFFACASPVVATLKNGGSTGVTGAMTVSSFFLPVSAEPWFTTTGTNNFVLNLGTAVQCSGTAYYIDS